ncbi:hypothetical protein PVK06_038207 [Gossypium arboreum]|uniref:Uncharacterized protein n=1 Tax=Gossypium arboreum TaxID=29729 RepID=A0ABR0MZH7_GOSAR|nr:hypothetical protein PVK06_038207 [Gossypium arboreum]
MIFDYEDGFPAEELPALRVGDLVPSSGDGKLRARNRRSRIRKPRYISNKAETGGDTADGTYTS